MSGYLYVVVGGQFGSEGKGAVTARLCRDLEDRGRRVISVRVGGSNAGHTVIGRCPPECEHPDGHPWRLRHVPVAAVSTRNSRLIISQGSEIDRSVLFQELNDLDRAGYSVSSRLRVDRMATVVEDRHAQQETALTMAIGSTGKGVGAARSDRIWRQAAVYKNYHVDGCNTTDILLDALQDDNTAVVIEGTQGYGLGLHTEFYPYTTSTDCRAIDVMAQAGISPWCVSPDNLRVLVCFRPYPIRVAGNSGPLRYETTWENLGLSAEYTTVTGKLRRVGDWDKGLASKAMVANGYTEKGSCVYTAFTMMDHVDTFLRDQDGDMSLMYKVSTSMRSMVADCHNAPVAFVGTGPNTALVNQDIYL